MDLSEPAYGVALLNDCKYGYQVKGNVINLNLLRSPGHPDPVADRGRHEFTYALYPHAGDHIVGEVARAAYELNLPLSVAKVTPHPGPMSRSVSLFAVDNPAVVLETVKPAEDGRGLVVRLYESTGSAVKASLCTALNVRNAQLTDLLERPLRRLAVRGSTVPLAFGPFEIVTVRVG